MDVEDAWRRAIEQTWVVRLPKQRLATFGPTNVGYYVVTEPIYEEQNSKTQEGVVRSGRVLSQKPTVITPTYALNLNGFSSEAYKYFKEVAQSGGSNSPGILYQYRNESEKMDIVSGAASDIAHKISDDLDRRKEDMSVVMVGVDEFWDVALLKFIYEFTSSSISGNLREFYSMGLLEPQTHLGGVPKAAVREIEGLFSKVKNGGDPDILKTELDRWGMFGYYQDRFLDLFR